MAWLRSRKSQDSALRVDLQDVPGYGVSHIKDMVRRDDKAKGIVVRKNSVRAGKMMEMLSLISFGFFSADGRKSWCNVRPDLHIELGLCHPEAWFV